jgi:hypothetical protein
MQPWLTNEKPGFAIAWTVMAVVMIGIGVARQFPSGVALETSLLTAGAVIAIAQYRRTRR